MAPPKSGKSAPPIPHVSVKAELPEATAEAVPGVPGAIAKKKRLVMIGAGAVGVLVLGGVAFFAYTTFFSAPPPPPPPAVKKKAEPVAAKAPPAAAPTAPAPAAAGKLSETQSALAHAPAKAIGKAQDAVAARQASGQGNVADALATEELANRPAVGEPVAKAPAPKAATAKQSVTRGVSATTELEVAAVEASMEFRTYVANAKVSGVFQGSPARAMINGRLVRTGETVDAGLGILFEGVDPVKRQLFFKDRTGAIVARKY
ncbi:MAG: hypothetical protein HZC55_00520 [Verrucomicrobia bacterium]|nr:hypothetical protein [Verrucomicrobiota bacterium]